MVRTCGNDDRALMISASVRTDTDDDDCMYAIVAASKAMLWNVSCIVLHTEWMRQKYLVTTRAGRSVS